MHPDWLGSPQHFVGGLVLALAVSLVVRRRVREWWVVPALALGAAAAAELFIEIVEYPILHSDEADSTAYYDTIADLAATMVGAVVGAALGLIGLRRSA
ncbi:MAG: hypothetical protein U0S48_13645 [Solirubrobacteraceae bacterium]